MRRNDRYSNYNDAYDVSANPEKYILPYIDIENFISDSENKLIRGKRALRNYNDIETANKKAAERICGFIFNKQQEA